MEEYFYIEILIEDKSGSILADQILKKYTNNRSDILYNIRSFKGIGKIPKKINKINNVKSKRLLNDLPLYLKGLNDSLKQLPYNKAIIVILDCDDENCVDLKLKLLEMYKELNISINVFFCIAIEEMEAWLLGDFKAIMEAYPTAKRHVHQNYKQDEIVGTWEYLADVVYKGGLLQLKRDANTYYEIGKQKCLWAQEIGKNLDIRNNNSPSFNYFISKLDSICNNGC